MGSITGWMFEGMRMETRKPILLNFSEAIGMDLLVQSSVWAQLAKLAPGSTRLWKTCCVSWKLKSRHKWRRSPLTWLLVGASDQMGNGTNIGGSDYSASAGRHTLHSFESI